MNVKNVMGMFLPKLKRKRIDLKSTTYNVQLILFLTAFCLITFLAVCPAMAQHPENSGAAQAQLMDSIRTSAIDTTGKALKRSLQNITSQLEEVNVSTDYRVLPLNKLTNNIIYPHM